MIKKILQNTPPMDKQVWKYGYGGGEAVREKAALVRMKAGLGQ